MGNRKKGRKTAKSIIGTVSVAKKGYGFVLPDESYGMKEDIFIPAKGIAGALDGDTVRISLEKSRRPFGKPEGRITEVLIRGNTSFVGTFEQVKAYGFVIPENKKIHRDIFIESGNIGKAKSGDKVRVEITKWSEDGYSSPEGKVVEIIAKRNESNADIKAILANAGIETKFPEAVTKETSKIDRTVKKKDLKGRHDFRDKRTVTIDGKDSKDFDDAVSLEMAENGNYILGVHIADVSHYVKSGTALDEEALKRGNSIYLVDQVVPMLPEKLSNGICSLNPEVDRLTLSIVMEIDRGGNVVSHDIMNSVICSNARLVYDEVSDLLEGKNTSLYKRYPQISEDLIMMGELAGILSEKRIKRGSIEFEFDEPYIVVDAKGKVKDIKIHERRTANRMIEEFMLLANETVAEHFYWLKQPFVYRVHERPDIEKIREIREYIRTIGLDIKLQNTGVHSAEINNLLVRIKGEPYEAVVSTLLLRAMKKAYYDVESLGHFGLGTSYYCHFTSPIRRYADLTIHRIIKDTIDGKVLLDDEWVKKHMHDTEVAAIAASETERVAIELEREVNKLKMAEYMESHIGDRYSGVISGVNSYGFFVQLPNTIEGLVRVESIKEDYYEYDKKRFCLVGKKTGKMYTIGKEVEVIVTDVDMMLREIDFEIA